MSFQARPLSRPGAPQLDIIPVLLAVIRPGHRQLVVTPAQQRTCHAVQHPGPWLELLQAPPLRVCMRALKQPGAGPLHAQPSQRHGLLQACALSAAVPAWRRLVFVLKQTQPEKWVNNGGADFAVQIKPPSAEDIVAKVVNAEATYTHWSLFNRFCMALEVLDAADSVGETPYPRPRPSHLAQGSAFRPSPTCQTAASAPSQPTAFQPAFCELISHRPATALAAAPAVSPALHPSFEHLHWHASRR